MYQGVPHQEQGNAVKLLARLLRAVSEAGATLRLFALEGGVAENIVPETAAVRFCYEAAPRKSCALFSRRRSLSSPKSWKIPLRRELCALQRFPPLTGLSQRRTVRALPVYCTFCPTTYSKPRRER